MYIALGSTCQPSVPLLVMVAFIPDRSFVLYKSIHSHHLIHIHSLTYHSPPQGLNQSWGFSTLETLSRKRLNRMEIAKEVEKLVERAKLEVIAAQAEAKVEVAEMETKLERAEMERKLERAEMETKLERAEKVIVCSKLEESIAHLKAKQVELLKSVGVLSLRGAIGR